MPHRPRNAARPCAPVMPLIALLGACAVTLGACSSSTTSATSPAGAAKPVSQGRPVASGSIASVSSSSMVVQNARSGSSVTVDWSSSTTFNQTVTASASDLVVGDCAQVFGASTSPGPASARTVAISMPSSAGCARPSGVSGRSFGAGGGPGGGGRGFGGGALPFVSAFGSVTSVGSGIFTVKGTASSGSSSTTFGYNPTTTFTKIRSAKSSSVSSGQCATAFGSPSSSGAVAASTITLRPAGPNGCFGFGGGGFGGGASQA